MIRKLVAVFIIFTILLAHDPDKENIQWKDYTRFGVVNNGTINETGLATYYRIKRVTQNTFRDLRFFGHFFSPYSDFRIRAKSSNKYDFNKKYYHFRTYVYHKSNKNLRYHYNQGLGVLLQQINNGNMTLEIGWAYDISDYIESNEKTSYIKSAGSIDKGWGKTKTKLEIEYFHQISGLIESNISRFQTIFEIEYRQNTNWGITLGLVNEYYTKNQNNFRTSPTNIFISVNKFGFFN